jgi:arylsulfatase A-like enzyme
MSGKWHLGAAEVNRPHHHGFDHWTGFLAGCIDYYSHIFYWGMNVKGPGINPTHDLWQDNREIMLNGEYFTHLVTRQAVTYLRQAQAENNPFFLYVPYNAPHYPMHAPEKYMERFKNLPWDRQVMAAMLSAVDDGVGEIMAEIERLGMAETTVTFFTSDNGPSRESRNWLDGTLDPYYGGSAGRLKGHKFSLYDGGVRMPAILNAPGIITAGQVLDAACASMDIFPTFLRLAGGDLSAYEVDGIDLSKYVSKGMELPARDIYWEMNNQTAVRRGKWKLVLNGQLVEGAPVEDAIHLSDLDEDLGERVNLQGEYPEIAVELTHAAQSWRGQMEARWQREFAQGV